MGGAGGRERESLQFFLHVAAAAATFFDAHHQSAAAAAVDTKQVKKMGAHPPAPRYHG